jgi:VanZ family protein
MIVFRDPLDVPKLRFARIWWAMGWFIVAFITVSCLEPPRYVPNLHLWDKAEHALAFYGMTVWFGGLIRERSYWRLAAWMLLFGASIEVAQGVMGLGRDMDVMDFAADTIGVAIALVMLYLGLGSWTERFERIFGLSLEPS